MSLYQKDGVEGITEWQIRANHPNTSFPQVMELRHVEEFGYSEYVAPVEEAKPYEPTAQDKIYALEASITDRRWREFALTGDKSFIESVDKQIAELRKAL